MNNQEIVTSAGSVGVERRSFNRLYVTPSEPIEKVEQIHDLYGRIESIVDRRREVSRGVLRVITTLDTLHEAVELGISPEAAIPLDGSDSTDAVLALYAHNSLERSSTIEPIDFMIDQTRDERVPQSLYTATSHELERLLYNFIGPSQYNSLHELWGETFGWTTHQIIQFSRAIMQQHNANEGYNRTLWFSGLSTGNDAKIPEALVSAAMAERVKLQGFNKTIHLVESTEWRSSATRTRPEGSIIPVLTGLNRQILRDIPDAVIVAECNFASRADRRGYQAGFIVPDITLAPQILVQNVGVHDGKNNWPLRDFTMMVYQDTEGAQPCM